MIEIRVTGTKEEVKRKVRILQSLIKADMAKKDQKSLKYHKQALVEHEAELRRMS